MNEFELRGIIKDESGQNDEDAERRRYRKTKDKTQDSEGFHPNFNELRLTNMNHRILARTKR